VLHNVIWKNRIILKGLAPPTKLSVKCSRNTALIVALIAFCLRRKESFRIKQGLPESRSSRKSLNVMIWYIHAALRSFHYLSSSLLVAS